MKCKMFDLFNVFNIERSQLNTIAVKSLIHAMISKKICILEKQEFIFDENTFIECWKIYSDCLYYFDPNYNRKDDFYSFFRYIIDCKMIGTPVNFHALFCPGYTKYGYKLYLGNTTLWKLRTLREIIDILNTSGLTSSMTCYYSDVFLENCNDQLEPNWRNQLNYNRQLFHAEGRKYFGRESIKNASDIPIFVGEKDKEGYVDRKIVDNIPKATYNAFVKCNKKFYVQLGFTEEEMNYRNDRLITMYRIFSDYLNEQKNSVFLPMENMYERENIFSENGTCTMYLKLKK